MAHILYCTMLHVKTLILIFKEFFYRVKFSILLLFWYYIILPSCKKFSNFYPCYIFWLGTLYSIKNMIIYYTENPIFIIIFICATLLFPFMNRPGHSYVKKSHNSCLPDFTEYQIVKDLINKFWWPKDREVLYHWWVKKKLILTYVCRLDILFLSNHDIHKSLWNLCFCVSDPLIDRFY